MQTKIHGYIYIFKLFNNKKSKMLYLAKYFFSEIQKLKKILTANKYTYPTESVKEILQAEGYVTQ